MGRTNDAKAAIARQKQKKADAAKEKPAGELAAKPNPPAAKTRKPRPPGRDAASRDGRVKPIVKRLPPGSEIHKRWTGEKWEMILLVPDGGVAAWEIGHEVVGGGRMAVNYPAAREIENTAACQINHEQDAAFRGEEELFQMYLKSLEGGE